MTINLGSTKQQLIYATVILLITTFSICSLSMSWHKSFWRDEAFTALTASRSLKDIIITSSKDVSPPFYYFLIHFWTQILPQQDVVLRTSSLFFAIFTLGTIYEVLILSIPKLKSIKHNFTLQLLLMCFVTFNVIIFYFSAELRNYSLLMLLILWSFIAIFKIITTKARKWFLILFVANSILLYSHSLTIIWYIAQNFTFIFWAIISKKWRQLFLFLVTQALIISCFSPWLLILIKQTKNVSDSFWITFDPIKSLREYDGLFLINEGIIKYPRVELWITRLFKSLFILSFIIFVIENLLKFRHHASSIYQDFQNTKLDLAIKMLFTSIFLSIMGFYTFSIIISPVLYFRYLSMFAPLMILTICIALVYLYTFQKIIFKSIFIIYFYLVFLEFSGLISGNSKIQYRQITSNPKEVIFTQEALDISPCRYYSSSCIFVGNITQTPRFIGSSQLDFISSISGWEVIDQTNFSVLYRDSTNIDDLFPAGVFLKKDYLDLGEGLFLQRYSKINLNPEIF